MQKRQAVRFRASVPVELLDLPANGWLGVTLDLAETGCTLLWPRRLAVGTRLKLRLHLGAESLECDGEIASVQNRVGSDWMAHGVCFRFHPREDVDRLADALYNMAVPEIFARLTRPSGVRVADSSAAASEARAFLERGGVPALAGLSRCSVLDGPGYRLLDAACLRSAAVEPRSDS